MGLSEGLKHDSWIMCDQLVSLAKSQLTDFMGTLSPQKLERLDIALRAALDLR